MPVEGLDQFTRELDQIGAAIPRAIADLVGALAIVGYQDVVDRSPVVTGAYRAENVIGEGEGESVTTLLYEPPNRPGPDTIVKLAGGVALEPPNIGDAKASVASVEPFEVVTLLNQRFYSHFVEDRHQTYTLAADRISGVASNVKLEIPGFDRV